MTQPTEGPGPQSLEEAQQADAGAPRESGPAATREALESAERFRLSEMQLDARDERFSRPRKEQGPPLAGAEETPATGLESTGEAVEETPVPVPPEESQ